MGFRSFKFCAAFALAATGACTAALAQDDWRGFYGGLTLDAVRATSDVGSNAVHRYKEDSAQLGFYAGYSFVRPGGLVWGPEVSLTSVSTSGAQTDATLGNSSFDGGFLLMPRVRAGFVTGRTYLYGIAGLGITDAMARPAGLDGSDVVISPSIGVGAEFAMRDGWHTKVEAVHHSFDSPEFDFNGTTERSDNSLTQITFGIGRKF